MQQLEADLGFGNEHISPTWDDCNFDEVIQPITQDNCNSNEDLWQDKSNKMFSS